MLARESLKESDVLVFPEAGGGAAHSAAFMLREVSCRKLFVDLDPKPLKMWEALGYEVMLEEEFMAKHLDLTGVKVVPCDEYFRKRTGITFPYSQIELEVSLDKRLSNKVVEEKGSLLRAPAELKRPLVMRDRLSAGSTGVRIIEVNDDVVINEYIDGVEYVIDFNPENGLCFPRITHHLRKGADTYCTLIGKANAEYYLLEEACKEAASLFNVKGPANLQLINSGGELVFVEIGLRVSGSSYMNTELFGGNIILGDSGDQSFDTIDYSTMLGGMNLEDFAGPNIHP